jgi:hypothetical protein
MGVFLNDCGVGWGIYITRKIGNWTREVAFVLLIEFSFKGGRVFRLPLAHFFIINVHGKCLVQRERWQADNSFGLWQRGKLSR